MAATVHKWVKISLLNLFLVALVGVILRYKIILPLPFIDQKHLLHGHSHFAFTGWVTQILMSLLLQYIAQNGYPEVFKKYAWLLVSNLLTDYGMLITFPLQGYGFFSIFFSTLSILVSYLFGYFYWKDLNKLKTKHIAHWWFKTALLFNAISSLGAFALVFLTVNQIVHQNWYLSAVYFFLHFQYNGWFFFACMGLLMATFQHLQIASIHLKHVFILFLTACRPAYFLSAPWISLPLNVYPVYIAAGLAQLIAWFLLLMVLKRHVSILRERIPAIARFLFLLSASALTIKLFLQLGSTYKPLGQLAFGFRPIVIGYLHLVFLGLITLFLLGFLVAHQLLLSLKKNRIALLVFTFGVILNEILLMTQGIAALLNKSLPYSNEALFLTALILLFGLFLLLFPISKEKNGFSENYPK